MGGIALLSAINAGLYGPFPKEKKGACKLHASVMTTDENFQLMIYLFRLILGI